MSGKLPNVLEILDRYIVEWIKRLERPNETVWIVRGQRQDRTSRLRVTVLPRRVTISVPSEKIEETQKRIVGYILPRVEVVGKEKTG